MLSRLLIENIALIDKTELSLTEGLNVLSGETGAGKSIIIDSLYFVLGARADKGLIRNGSNKAIVEAVFEQLNDDVIKALTDMGFEDEGVLIINRSMTESRQDIRVNGRAVTLNMLRSITAMLVDILGQNGHQMLLDVTTHLPLLDRFGIKELEVPMAEYTQLYNEYIQLTKMLSKYGDEQKRTNTLELLSMAIEEIKAANPQIGEQETLKEKRNLYYYAERILGNLDRANSIISNDDASVIGLLNSAIEEMRFPASKDSNVATLEERLHSARIELSDIAQEIDNYLESFDYDEAKAKQIEQRLDLIQLLCKKYGGSIEKVLEYKNNAEKQYDELLTIDRQMVSLEKRRIVLVEQLFASATKLSTQRRKVALRFADCIMQNLKPLGMPSSKFEVLFNALPTKDSFLSLLTASGIDNVEFMFSANIGEPTKPLNKIISGGENSRIMLALKKITADLDGIPTLVFDEIDTGISGNIADEVAKKLYDISNERQVIAITHLPQLASMADTHYLIEKHEFESKTRTVVKALSYDASIEEIARLAGGATHSELALPHARQLKSWADSYKNHS